MPRGGYIAVTQANFTGGIEESHEEAKENQVLDASNMWAPDGVAVTRPGLQAIGALGAGTFTQAIPVMRIYQAAGAGTFTAPAANLLTAPAALVAGDMIYFQVSSTLDARISWLVSVANTTACDVKLEYYNHYSAAWETLPHYYYVAPTGTAGKPFSSTVMLLSFAPLCTVADGGSFGTTTINSVSGTWLRLVITGGQIDNGTQLNLNSAFTGYYSGRSDRPIAYRQLSSLKFTNKELFAALSRSSAEVPSVLVYPAPHPISGPSSVGFVSATGVACSPSMLSTVTHPQFNEAWIAYSDQVWRYNANANTLVPATVETDPVYVGTVGGVKSPFHPDYLAQLAAWPNGRYWTFFGGQLWTANLPGEPFTVRWSAAQPAHKVWPALSYEVLVEEDESPITGLAVLGEHLCVFKRNSIYRMVYTGVNSLGQVNAYTPVRVPGRIGTVAGHSIQEVNGNLVFLAEDGVYAFDGVNKPEKISQPIEDTMHTISRSEEEFSIAVHWPDRHAYILLLPNSDAALSQIVVYDYEAGAWWKWDGAGISWLFRREGENDRDEVYAIWRDCLAQYVDNHDDLGREITAYLKTHRVGFGDGVTKTLRELQVGHQSVDSDAIQVEMVADDVTSATTTLDARIASTPLVGTAVVGATTLAGPDPRRLQRLSTRLTGQWFTIKISNTARSAALKLFRLASHFVGWGRR